MAPFIRNSSSAPKTKVKTGEPTRGNPSQIPVRGSSVRRFSPGSGFDKPALLEPSGAGRIIPIARFAAGPTQGATNPAGNVPQQWSNSCGANTLMAMEASLSPGLAAYYSSLTGTARKAMESAIMRSSGSFNESSVHPLSSGNYNGWGVYEMKKQVSNRFGGDAVEYPPPGRSITQDGAVDTLLAVAGGNPSRPVAIALAHHWVAATAVRTTDVGTREVLIHDSYSGKSAWVPEQALRGTAWASQYFPDSAAMSDSGGGIHNLVYPGEASVDTKSSYRAEQNKLAPPLAPAGPTPQPR